MKNKEEIFVGLDIGTSKICALVGLKTEGASMEVIGVGTAPSKGIKKGCVFDIDRTSDAIVTAIEEAEEMADVEINSVFVNITGNHIKSFNSFGSVPVSNEHYEITLEDSEKAIKAAKAVSIPMERMVLHVLPLEYNIDGQGGIIDPVGMSGVKLEVGVHIITSAITSVQNIIKCLNRANLEYEEFIFSSIASSSSSLTDEEKEMGVVMIDIGGGTSDIAIYVNGTMQYSDVLAGGGNQITNDIAVGLRVPFNKAEEIKKRYGSALRFAISASEEFMVPGVLGRPSKSMPCRDLASIIEARIEETFLLIKKRIESSGLQEKIGSGIVLTGGSALLRDIDKLASRVFNIPIRIGRVREIAGMDYILESPAFASCVGLLVSGQFFKKDKKEVGTSQKRVAHLFYEWMKKILHK